MESINKFITKRLIFACLFSCLFIVGILFIVFGLKLHYQVLLIIGLFICFIEVYLLPLLWFNYAAWLFYKKVYNVVVTKGMLTTIEISNYLNKKDKDVTKGINILCENGLLDEYVFKDQCKLIKK